MTWLVAEAGYARRRRTPDRRPERTREPEWEQVEPRWSGRSRRHTEGGQR
ncbi:hypothetical protein PUR71_18755 [Streptomyces sp. SP17BM10]|nr:hypothetical protein [Streptomyces sp. SP17BM10]MEE1784934.1 hypothetical protein [Streptomyces sp. SP17BM10]